MTDDRPEPSRGRTRVGFGYWRLSGDTQAMSLVLAGLVLVFALAIAHDEIVDELILAGWLPDRFREIAELGLGLGIFAAWSALTLAFAGLIRRSAGGRQ
jgi:MFS family permease